MARGLSQYGRDLIKRFEGLRLEAYPDGDGYSVGYGHNGVPAGTRITRAEADQLFDLDVRRFEVAVNNAVRDSTTQQQYDALVSFTYNVGEGSEATGKGLRGSTLLKKHNAGDVQGAAAEFGKWINSKGKPNEVLKNRRAVERALYLEGQHAAPPSSPPVVLPPLPPEFPPPLVAGAGGQIAWQWVLVPVFFWPSVAGGGERDGEAAEGGGVARLADESAG